MKALSVRQPWAYLILEGGKNVENRTWRTGYRGPLLIHASRTIEGSMAIRSDGKLIECPVLKLHTGKIVGMVELVNCYLPDMENPWAEPGMWHWLLEDPLPFPEPIPYRGHQGLFEIPDELVAAQIEAARQALATGMSAPLLEDE